MSTFTDWKPSFVGAGSSSISSSPFSLANKLAHETEIIDSAKPKIELKAKELTLAKNHDKEHQTIQLNKLDEEIEEEEEAEEEADVDAIITELSTPQLSKRNSAIPEIKPLSPGTSLSGVFYCSSSTHSISNRKSSLSIQTQASSRTSISSTAGESVHSSGINQTTINKCKLQRRSTLNVSNLSSGRRNRTRLANHEELSDKEKDMQINDLEEEEESKSKPRSVSSDLTLDSAFHTTFLSHHKQELSSSATKLDNEDEDDDNSNNNNNNQSSQPTTSNYANIQPSIVTIVEEVGRRTIVPIQFTAIDFNRQQQQQHEDDSLTNIRNITNGLTTIENTLTTTTTTNTINTVVTNNTVTVASSKTFFKYKFV